MFFNILVVALVTITAFPAFAKTDMVCPEASATPWRAALEETDIKKYVAKRHDGNWSTYIAHWERQIDTARDVQSRKKALVVRFGKNRKSLKGQNLENYIIGMSQRVDLAYCLEERERIAKSLSEIEGQSAAEMAKRKKEGKRLSNLIGCPKCHGESGTSEKPEVPNIAGQKIGYLVNQLRAFQKEHAVNTSPFGSTLRSEKDMQKWAKSLTPDDKLNISVYYGTQECQSGTTKPSSATQQPENANVCLACHGNNGASISQVVPRLAGRKEAYLLAELRAFRMTKGDPRSFRFNNRRYHQFMSAIAAPLTNRQMEILAKWFSSQSCKS